MAVEKRGYQPSAAEMKQAENMMSKRERKSSKDRESAYNAGKERGQSDTKKEFGSSIEELADAYVDATVYPDDGRRKKLEALVEARVKSDPEILRRSFLKKALSIIKDARSPTGIDSLWRTFPRDVMNDKDVRVQMRETGKRLLIEGLQQGSLSAVREYVHGFDLSGSTLNDPEVIKALKETIISRMQKGSFESRNLFEVYQDYGGLPVEITSDKKIEKMARELLRNHQDDEKIKRLFRFS